VKKIINEIIPSLIQHHFKKIFTMMKRNSSQGCKDVSMYTINVIHCINTKKEKNMVISIDSEKAFSKIQHPFRKKC
jgi:hypothetical protein